MYSVGWQDIKNFVNSRSLSIQYVELNDVYLLMVFDGPFQLSSQVNKTTPKNNDQIDFEDNYKSTGNKKLSTPTDSDGSPLQRMKITTSGWSFQFHCLEFTLSQLNSVYSKNPDGTDFNFATIKCYDSNDIELTTQSDCDINAVKTVIDWEPTHDYEIIGGSMKQKSIPTEDIRLWNVGLPDIPEVYGGSKNFISNVNLKYITERDGIRIDGRAPKGLIYDPIYHTNKLRYIFKHSAGFKHDIFFVLEIFKP